MAQERTKLLDTDQSAEHEQEQNSASTTTSAAGIFYAPPGDGLTPRQRSLLQMQQTVGNAAVQRYLRQRTTTVQRTTLDETLTQFADWIESTEVTRLSTSDLQTTAETLATLPRQWSRWSSLPAPRRQQLAAIASLVAQLLNRRHQEATSNAEWLAQQPQVSQSRPGEGIPYVNPQQQVATLNRIRNLGAFGSLTLAIRVSFYNESIEEGLTRAELADAVATIGLTVAGGIRAMGATSRMTPTPEALSVRNGMPPGNTGSFTTRPPAGEVTAGLTGTQPLSTNPHHSTSSQAATGETQVIGGRSFALSSIGNSGTPSESIPMNTSSQFSSMQTPRTRNTSPSSGRTQVTNAGRNYDETPRVRMPPGTIAQDIENPMDLDSHLELYSIQRGQNPGREAMVMQNTRTGESVVVTGTETMVALDQQRLQGLLQARSDGHWMAVRHSHPYQRTNLGEYTSVQLYPSTVQNGVHGDFVSLYHSWVATSPNDVTRRQPVQSAIDVVLQDGTPAETRFGIDSRRTEPWWIEIPGPRRQGRQNTLRAQFGGETTPGRQYFPTLRAFHDELNRRYPDLMPGVLPPEFDQRLPENLPLLPTGVNQSGNPDG